MDRDCQNGIMDILQSLQYSSWRDSCLGRAVAAQQTENQKDGELS